MEKIKVKTFDKELTEEERKALYIKETILKIFENNTVYLFSNSEVFEKDIEVFFEDYEEKIEFVVEESPIHSEYDQIVKYELLEDIWKKAQEEKDAEFKKKVLEFGDRFQKRHSNEDRHKKIMELFKEIFGDYHK